MKASWTALVLFLCFALSAQNLVPNANLGNFDSCPMFISDFTASEWVVPTTATSDYYNECGPAAVGVPSNLIGFQSSLAGGGYAGLVTYELSTGYREYIQVPLTSSLESGSCYELTLVYSPADEAGFSNGIGMLLSEGVPGTYVGQIPQLMKTEVSESNEVWHTMVLQYVAQGNETHVTVGNFNNDANTTFQAGSGNLGSFLAYYYIDSVGVVLTGTQSTEITVDLGEDLLVCNSDFPVTITSSLPDATNVWSTGESGTSIDVNSPGVYYVQSFMSCAYAIDSIEISVIEDPTIEIDDETLCEGSSYLIELDASLGDYLWDDGSEEASYEVTESGSYAVTLTHGCGEIVEVFEVDVLTPIDIPEPMNLQLCESELPYVVDFIELNDGINEFLWQDGSTSPGIIINTDGTFTVEIYNDCFSDMVDFDVEISAEYPSFVNFTDTIKCIGEEVIIDPGFIGVDFLWQDGSTLPFFLAPGPGEYSVTVSNFCGTDQFDFTIIEAIELEFDLGNDVSICPGDSALINAFVGGTSISWSNGSSGNSTWATEEGQLIATAAGLCGPVSDTVNIFFNGMAPQIDVPDSLLVCTGDTISLSAADDISGIDFIWNTGEDGASISIYQGGTYVVSGENSCGIVTDSVIVTLGESLPDPVLDDIYEICAGDTIDLQIETNGGAVLWSTGSTDSSIQIFEEGSYFVSLTNSCTTKEDSFTLVFTQDLNPLDLGPDFGICEGDSMQIDAGTFTGSYIWSTGSEDELIIVNEVGSYSLQISGECNTINDTVEVTSLGTSPIIDLGEDVAFCDGDSVVVDIGSAIVDEVIWNTSSTENSITIFTAGSYIVVGNNECGMDSDTIVAVINNEVPQIELGDDQQICPGDSVTLDLGNVAGDIIWNTGDEGTSIEVFEGGQYFAILSSSCGSSEDSVLVVILEAAPEIELGEDQTLCFGETLDFDLLVGNETTIEWSNGETDNENSFQESGLIWVALSNTCGEINDSLNLDIIPLVDPIDLGADQLICDENSFQINGGIIQEDVNILWNTTETSDAITIVDEGEYWLQITNSCFSYTDTIIVDFGESPSPFDLGEADTICRGETVMLDGFQGDQFEYLWQDNSTASDYVVVESGTYELMISNICGTVTDQFELTVLEVDAIETTLQDNYELCAGDSLEIDLTGIIADFIEWNDGSTDKFRLLSEPGNYVIELANMCSDTIINFLFEDKNCLEGELFIPNTFTPDGNGINDVFSANFSENWLSPELKVSIYNRWGEEVFYSEAADFTWDGSFKGRMLNPGVYAYYIELDVEIDGQRRLIKEAGDVTIIK